MTHMQYHVVLFVDYDENMHILKMETLEISSATYMCISCLQVASVNALATAL